MHQKFKFIFFNHFLNGPITPIKLNSPFVSLLIPITFSSFSVENIQVGVQNSTTNNWHKSLTFCDKQKLTTMNGI